MLFRIGDIANEQETSDETIECNDYVSALEKLVEEANLYCKPADKEAENCKDMVDEFVRENSRLGFWNENE